MASSGVFVTYIPNPMLEAEWELSGEAAAMMLDLGDRIMLLAARNAPYVTGTLARSIEAQLGEENGHLTVLIGSELRYAGFVEYGTSKMAAEPYLRPALDEVMY